MLGVLGVAGTVFSDSDNASAAEQSADSVFNVELQALVTSPVIQDSSGSAVEKINLDVPSTGDFTSDYITIKVGTNNVSGYSLTLASADNSADFIHSSAPEPITDMYIIPTLTTEATGGASFPMNSWGYRVNDGDDTAKYVGLPTSSNPTTIKTTDGPSSSSTTKVEFGVRANKDKVSGTYAKTLVISATTNPAPQPEPSLCGSTPTMQAFNKNTAVMEQQIQLCDERDGKNYWVAKLADNNVWMTQNLDYDLASKPALSTTTSDVASDRTITLGDWGNYDPTEPYYYRDGDYYLPGGTGSKTSTSGLAANSTDWHYALGSYYSWTAAVAEESTSAYTEFGTQMPNSICPKGWRLPQSNDYNDGEFTSLVSAYGWNDVSYEITGNMWNSPLFFGLSGLVYGGSLRNVGSGGDVWSGTVYDDGLAFYLYFGDNGLVRPDDDDDRYRGFSVRCVAR